METRIYYSSKIKREYRKPLENLLFFNENQKNFFKSITRIVDEFGSPRIEERNRMLEIKVGMLHDIQCIYAIERQTDTLIGVVVFIRYPLNTLLILHIAVDSTYSFKGKYADNALTIKLINLVIKSAKKIKGVDFVSLAYQGHKDQIMAIPVTAS